MFYSTLLKNHFFNSFYLVFLQEAALTDALKRLSDDVDEKLDRKEIDPLRDYLGG